MRSLHFFSGPAQIVLTGLSSRVIYPWMKWGHPTGSSHDDLSKMTVKGNFIEGKVCLRSIVDRQRQSASKYPGWVGWQDFDP